MIKYCRCFFIQRFDGVLFPREHFSISTIFVIFSFVHSFPFLAYLSFSLDTIQSLYYSTHSCTHILWMCANFFVYLTEYYAHSLLAQRTRIAYIEDTREADNAIESTTTHALKYELNSVHLSLAHCLYLFSVLVVVIFFCLVFSTFHECNLYVFMFWNGVNYMYIYRW